MSFYCLLNITIFTLWLQLSIELGLQRGGSVYCLLNITKFTLRLQLSIELGLQRGGSVDRIAKKPIKRIGFMCSNSY